MFKRIDKRIKKREQEERLGIDEETRDILGLNDTDSSESESESDSELSGSDAEMFQGSEDEESEAWGGIGGGALDEEDESEEEEEDESPSHIAFQIFTAKHALEEPIYAHPTQSNAHLCAICPGKMLISPQSITQHQTSNAHERRSKNIAKLAALPENVDGSLSDLLRQLDGRPHLGPQPQEGEEGMSRRAEKKLKTAEIRKVKREAQKAKAKAKKEKQKEEGGQGDKDVSGPTKAAGAQVVPSAKKDKKKDKKAKAEPSQPVQAKQAQPVKKDTAQVAATVKPKEPANDKKRKKEAEKVSVLPAEKKRKTDVPSSQKEITKQIKDIAKSATMRAHKAMSKAKQGNSDDKKGKKKTG